jgi:hypothetical protein
MIKKLFGSKKESSNTKVKKSKSGFSLEIDEDSEDTTPIAESITPVETRSQATPIPTADTPDWIQLLSKQNVQNTSATPPEDNTTFADKYLLTISSRGRRRPGGSMNKYMDMASEMKTPTMKR